MPPQDVQRYIEYVTAAHHAVLSLSPVIAMFLEHTERASSRPKVLRDRQWVQTFARLLQAMANILEPFRRLSDHPPEATKIQESFDYLSDAAVGLKNLAEVYLPSGKIIIKSKVEAEFWKTLLEAIPEGYARLLDRVNAAGQWSSGQRQGPSSPP